VTGRWFSPGTPVSSTNKTDEITEILLKVALNTIKQTNLRRNIPCYVLRKIYMLLWVLKGECAVRMHANDVVA